MSSDSENLIKTLTENGVVVMPTDTIYGVVGKALSESVVNRIYAIRKRNPDKPCIILMADVNELNKFSVNLSEKQKQVLETYWSFDSAQDLRPEAVSIILDCLDEKFTYLHRGTKTLAFRIPASEPLRDLLLKVGPLIAPSANTEGLPPAKNIEEAKAYFGGSVDLYVDGGEIAGKASKVVKLNIDGAVAVLRE